MVLDNVRNLDVREQMKDLALSIVSGPTKPENIPYFGSKTQNPEFSESILNRNLTSSKIVHFSCKKKPGYHIEPICKVPSLTSRRNRQKTFEKISPIH